jgi:hypothetical protein
MGRHLSIASLVLFSGLLIAGGVLVFANFNKGGELAVKAQTSQWTEQAGLGISVPACGSANVQTTCTGSSPTAMISWAYSHGCNDAWMVVHGPGYYYSAPGLPCTADYTIGGFQPNTTYTYDISWWALNPEYSGSYQIDKVVGTFTTLACTPPPPPTGLNQSCPAPGTNASLSWSDAPGATYYALRVDNQTANGWNGLCDGAQNPGDICQNVSSNSFSFSSQPSATYSWWVHACNSAGCSSPAIGTSFTCTPPPPSVDLKFNGSDGPITLEALASYTANWSLSGGPVSSCTASGSWSGPKSTSGGSETFNNMPRGTYTYALTCTGLGGSASDSVTVQVINVPKCLFAPDPGSIILPQTSTLSWSCQFADSCSIDHGIGSVNPQTGSKEVQPQTTTTYTLTCQSQDAERSFQATVRVFSPSLREILPRL